MTRTFWVSYAGAALGYATSHVVTWFFFLRKKKPSINATHTHDWGRWQPEWNGSIFQSRRCMICGWSESKYI